MKKLGYKNAHSGLTGSENSAVSAAEANRYGYNRNSVTSRLFLTPFVDWIQYNVFDVFGASRKPALSLKKAVKSEKSVSMMKIDFRLGKKRGLQRLIPPFIALTLLITLAGCGGGGGGAAGGSGVTVGGGGSGAASLSWTAPTTNVDASALTDLSGYKIHYGTSSGTYSTSVDVGNVTSSSVTGLTSGTTYYFVITAYDLSGNESAYSVEVNKTIA